MKLYCIVNPQAGRGTTAKSWPMIKRNLEKMGAEIIADFTQYIGHAEVLARQADGFEVDAVVAVGGDGTVNEVINGIIKTNIPLGLIPTGTGNDLCRTLNIPLDPLEAIIILAQGKKLEINVARVNGRYFVNVASAGFDAAVANWVNKKKFFKGIFAYYVGIIFNVLRNKHYQLTINLDGKIIKKKCTLVAVANGKYYGAGQKIAPQADILDNMFDIVVVNGVSRAEILKTFPSIKKGKHISNQNVYIYKAQEVTISSSDKVPVQADGETLNHLPCTFKISDRLIKVFVP